VGSGTKFFDVKKFGAACAYTMDGETKGEIEMETWSADAITISFQGTIRIPATPRGR
jgi:tripeptide aminopeptidase